MSMMDNIIIRSNETEIMPFDVERVRNDFPILNVKIRGRDLVYLDSAATAQKPRQVIECINDFYNLTNSNIHRGVHFLSEKSTICYENARRKVKDYINARDAKEIIFVRGATEAINLIAYSFGRLYINKDDEILISAMEHHSNIVPWQVLCRERGAKLVILPMDNNGELLMDQFDNLISGKTKLVSIVHASNSLGTINPVEEIIRKSHQHNIPVLLDGSQAIPHFKVDVSKLDCDFYVFSGHKLFGPTGIGILYGKESILENITPYQTGGDMIKTVSFSETQYNDLPYRFEAGTQNIADAIGLGAAIEYLESIDFEGAMKHEEELMQYALRNLSAFPSLHVIGNAEKRVPVISFVIDNMHPHDIGSYLDQAGIAIRTGHHCTQPVMSFFNVPATARASFAFYNSFDDVYRFLNSIDDIIERYNRFGTAGSDNESTYENTIMRHDKFPKNFRAPLQGCFTLEGFNPLCGDHIVLSVLVKDGLIEDISFQGELCAISKASASMMTESLTGKPVNSAGELSEIFTSLFDEAEITQERKIQLGELSVFENIKASPARVKCAMLPWQSLDRIIKVKVGNHNVQDVK